MKKIQLPVFICLLFSSAGYSQFNKGSLLLGADLGFNTQTFTSGITENKSHGFSFSPTLAVASRQNTFWGGSLNIEYTKSSASPSADQTVHSYGGSIFFRKYKQVTGRLYAFVQPGVLIGFSNFESENGPNFSAEGDGFFTGLNITPGISVNVSKKVYLEAGFSNVAAINYNHGETRTTNLGNTTTSKNSSFSFSSSLGSFTNNLYFGFRFIIPKNS